MPNNTIPNTQLSKGVHAPVSSHEASSSHPAAWSAGSSAVPIPRPRGGVRGVTCYGPLLARDKNLHTTTDRSGVFDVDADYGGWLVALIFYRIEALHYFDQSKCLPRRDAVANLVVGRGVWRCR